MSENLLFRAKEIIEKHIDYRPDGELRKAAFGTTDLTTGGGLLAPQQAQKLIRLLRYPPTFLRLCRLVPMKGPTDRIDRITFGDRILHAATENTAISASLQAVPSTSKVELSTALFKAEVQLTYEALQDSIEGGQNVRGNSFENTVFSLISARLAEDIEEIAMNSDTSNGALHNDLQQIDGWLKLARDQASYDHGGATLSKSAFKAGHLLLPKAYRRNKMNLVFLTGVNAEVEWEDELADRVTVNGDMVAWGDKKVSYAYGIPVIPCAAMPEESGSSSNIGEILHTHPKNAILGVWRNIFMEVDRDIRAGTLIIVCSVRFDTQFEQVEGADVITNVKIA